MKNLRGVGETGEDIALGYLERNGFGIVTTNWFIPGGELDIVATEWGETVFIEVKYRRGTDYGTALESLSREKRRRFFRSAMLYATRHRLAEDRIRFDFIAIQKSPTGYRIEHFRRIGRT